MEERTDRRLVVLPISPWSERARWALDHHGLKYKTLFHEPLVGERRLRKLVGATKQRATVPVLLVGGEVLTESWDIARYADREGPKSRLIPAEHEAEIKEWSRRADQAMEASRGLITLALQSSREAQLEGLPRGVPGALRPLLLPVARYAMGWFGRKYGVRREDAAAYRERVRASLQELRGALARSSPYLLGTFTYADIVTATSLQGIVPVDGAYIRLGPGMRAAWTQPELAAEFSDLIAWRDQLYAQHRRAP
ncbi:MAG: glutathione S-transferase [Polyangia bacterium]